MGRAAVSLEDNTPEGLVRMATNELRTDSRYDDPSAYRGGQPYENSLLKISADVIQFAGGMDANGRGVGEVSHRDERAMIIFKGHDPASPGDSLKCGSIDFFCTLEGRSDDAAQRRVMTLTPYELRVYVPIRYLAGEPPVVVPASLDAAWATGPAPTCGVHAGLATYKNYLNHEVQVRLNRPASAAQLTLLDEYQRRFGEPDDCAFNWIVSTFIDTGLVQ